MLTATDHNKPGTEKMAAHTVESVLFAAATSAADHSNEDGLVYSLFIPVALKHFLLDAETRRF